MTRTERAAIAALIKNAPPLTPEVKRVIRRALKQSPPVSKRRASHLSGSQPTRGKKNEPHNNHTSRAA